MLSLASGGETVIGSGGFVSMFDTTGRIESGRLWRFGKGKEELRNEG